MTPFQKLPSSVTVSGNEYEIDPDFRIMIQLETELRKPEPQIGETFLEFYAKGVPQDIKAAIDEMISFYNAEVVLGSDSKEGDDSNLRNYDFKQDEDALAASFLETYGLDLYSCSLHWWRFRRLMFNLPHESPFIQRVHYRSASLKGMSKEQAKHYKKMKKLYRLKDENRPKMSVEEREKAFREKVEAQKKAQENREW